MSNKSYNPLIAVKFTYQRYYISKHKLENNQEARTWLKDIAILLLYTVLTKSYNVLFISCEFAMVVHSCQTLYIMQIRFG
jgi:hypothetical protein